MALTTNKKESELKIIRLMDELEMQREAENRVYQAFTYGLKLDKQHMPDRFKLFDSLNKLVNYSNRLGLTKE